MIGTWDSSQLCYYITDHLGSTRAVVDQAGAVKENRDYYPFGLEMPDRSSTSDYPYKYTGHERDKETGINLDYMLARGYDPVTGRFLQIDPYARLYPNLSPYTYALNNPILYNDPTGKYPDCSTQKQCLEKYAPGAIVENTIGTFRIEEDGSITTVSLNESFEMTTTVSYERPSFGSRLSAGMPVVLGTAAVDSPAPGPADVVAGGILLGLVADAAYNAITFADQETITLNIPSAHNLEKTPNSKPEDFENVRGTKAKKNKKTGEIWMKDMFHKNHWEVYKNKKNFDNGNRDRSVWFDGRVKQIFKK